MGTLGLLTITEARDRSYLSLVKDGTVTPDATLQFYIDLAESLIDAVCLNKGKDHFELNVGYAVLLMVQHLIVNDQENVLISSTGPFAQERLGSYSYTVKKIVEQDFPPRIRRILELYQCTGINIPLSISTRVFKEFTHNEESGFRTYHDLSDREFFKEEHIVP